MYFLMLTKGMPNFRRRKAGLFLFILTLIGVSDYPSGNGFMVFIKSGEPPNAVTEAVKQLGPSNGVRVPDFISSISHKLQNALSTSSRASPISIDEDEDDEMEDVDEEESEGDSGFSDNEEEDFPDGPMSFTSGNHVPTSTLKLTQKAAAQLNRRIRADMRAVRMQGHRIGILSGMSAHSQTSILSISIQATKLDLSEEAMQAWDIEPNQYVTLLIRYSDGYKPYEALIAEPAKNSGVDFRIGVGNGYKPSTAAAFSAFSDSNKVGVKESNGDNPTSQANQQNQNRGFSNIFISSSLNEFINTKMISILKLRHATGFGWEDAKKCFDGQQGRPLQENADLYTENFPSKPDTDTIKGHASRILTDDHLADNDGGSLSFPLLAAQFALMYLIRCTEFCLVCHDKITAEFEALKPYVCDKPLCLYQYMALGFGPSVEHVSELLIVCIQSEHGNVNFLQEIQTQPYVVDLLLNFCYASASVSLSA